MSYVEVRLLGDLAPFQLSHRIHANSVRDAIRFIESQCEGFRQHLIKQAKLNAFYKVVVGTGREIEEKQLDAPIGADVITIVPVLEGAGNVGKIIAGIGLIAVGVFTGGIGFLGLSAASTILLGGTLLLSGIMGLFNKPGQKDEDDAKNNSFGGAVSNASGYGKVPLVLGCGYKGQGIIVGGIVVSGSIRSYEVAEADES